MRLTERLAGAWGALVGRATSGTHVLGGGNPGSPLFPISDAGGRGAPSPARLVDAYRSLIFFCCNLNEAGVTRVPMRLYAVGGPSRRAARGACRPRRVLRSERARLRSIPYVARTVGPGDDVDEVGEHPLLDVLDGGGTDGEHFDRQQLVGLVCRYVDVVGTAYLRKVPGPFAGLPAELWPLPAQDVDPRRFPGSALIEHYRYQGQKVETRDMLRFRHRPDLKDPYGSGASPARAAWEYAQLETAFVSVQQFLLYSPKPGMFVRPKDDKLPWGEPERRRLQADLDSRGRAGAGASLVSNVAADVDTITHSPADLAGLGISEYDLERVANCFDVPMPYLTRDTNLANMQAAEVAHARNGIEPRCRMIAAGLTRLARGLDDRLFFAFDDALERDTDRASRVMDRKLKNGTLTINEARLEDGYEGVAWGEEPWQAATLVQAGAAMRRQDQSEEARQKAIDAPPPDPEDDPEDEEDPGAVDPAGEASGAGGGESTRTSPADAPPAGPGRETEGEQRPPFPTPATSSGSGPTSGMPSSTHRATSGTPTGSLKEGNPFGLPEGTPISKEMRRAFATQMAALLKALPPPGSIAPIPTSFPSVADYTDPMASALTPIMAPYWDQAGKRTRMKLGLDADEWRVTDPHLRDKITGAAYDFAASTNETTDAELGHALDQLRREMRVGLIEEGESLRELRRRVQSVFTRASDSRALRIAQTEASRAVHSASLESARSSGVVRGKIWLLSTNACPRCNDLARGTAPGAGPSVGGRPAAAGPGPLMAPVVTKVGKAEHVRSDQVEKSVAKMLGGKQLDDNEPIDVRVEHGGTTHGVEVKSLLKGAKQNLSVHDDALLRKVEWMAEDPEGRAYHTVAVDDRRTYGGGEFAANYSGHDLYYRRGSGPYGLGSMHRVADAAELRRLMLMPDAELPEKARGELPRGQAAVAALREKAGRAHESRLLKDRARKARIKAEKAAAAAAASSGGGD